MVTVQNHHFHPTHCPSASCARFPKFQPLCKQVCSNRKLALEFKLELSYYPPSFSVSIESDGNHRPSGEPVGKEIFETRSDSRVTGTAAITVDFGKQVEVAPINRDRCRPIVNPSGFPLASHVFRPADVALHQQRPELLEKRDIRRQLVCAFTESETVIARWKHGLDSKDDGRSI